LGKTKEIKIGDGAFGMNNPVPKAGALPGCATPRLILILTHLMIDNVVSGVLVSREVPFVLLLKFGKCTSPQFEECQQKRFCNGHPNTAIQLLS
jgi:hypothetical protein